jgi:hypothetical protein
LIASGFKRAPGWFLIPVQLAVAPEAMLGRVNAPCLKMREDDPIVSVAAIIAAACSA